MEVVDPSQPIKVVPILRAGLVLLEQASRAPIRPDRIVLPLHVSIFVTLVLESAPRSPSRISFPTGVQRSDLKRSVPNRTEPNRCYKNTAFPACAARCSRRPLFAAAARPVATAILRGQARPCSRRTGGLASRQMCGSQESFMGQAAGTTL